MSIRTGLLLALCWPGLALATCAPDGWDKTALLRLKAEGFAIDTAAKAEADGDAARQSLAIALVDCLADPDPELRDGVAFEALSTWLRKDQLSEATRRALLQRLYVELSRPDANGFAAPFAALVLSEVARTDRIRPWLSDDERAAMVRRAVDWLAGVRDYRGFDAKEGWRHGVAHGSDWLLQLALNERVPATDLQAMLPAIATQAVPASGHAYVFGESARLARPLLVIAQRNAMTPAQWSEWFAALPARVGEPSQAWRDAAWLARRHDAYSLLTGLYWSVDQSGDAALLALKPGIAEALKRLP